MPVFDTATLDRFTPAELIGQPDAPVYLIRPAGMLERANYRRDVATLGARYVPDALLVAELRTGIREDLDVSEQADWLGLVDQLEDALATSEHFIAALMSLDAADRGNLDALARDMRQHRPAYAAMEADRTHWFEVAPYVAARHFLAGWEGPAPEFRLERGQVPEALLETALPEGHITAVGYRAMALMRPDRDAEKNSASRPGSPAGRATSTAARMRSTARAGKSRARSTRKTPAS